MENQDEQVVLWEHTTQATEKLRIPACMENLAGSLLPSAAHPVTGILSALKHWAQTLHLRLPPWQIHLRIPTLQRGTLNLSVSTA
jgi:hypothetical protein